MIKNLLLVSSIFLVCFSSCNKNKDERTLLGTYYLSEDDKNNFPFNDTLSPKYTSFDSVINFTFYHHSNNSIMMESCQSFSCDEFYKYELLMSVLNAGDYTIQYNLKANHSNNSNLATLTSYWYFIQDSSEYTPLYSMRFNIPIDSNEFNNVRFLYDSILVNDIIYYNVISDTTHGPGYQDENELDLFPTRFYYSPEYGIIKYVMSDGSNWELIRE